MKIKVVKKNEKQTEVAAPNFFRKTEQSIRKVERKVEENIMGWISDLRKKKSLEFVQAQTLFGSID